MKYFVGLFAGSAAILLALAPAFAQHTVAAKFDVTKTMTLTGTVTQIDWANPYSHVLMKVPVANSSAPARWAVEIESSILLAKNGWSQTTVKPGDVIKVEGPPARDGSKQISGKTIVLTSREERLQRLQWNASGETAYCRAQRRDGRMVIRGWDRLPGQTGYWGNPSKTALVQAGVTVQMDAYGLLKNIADVDKVAPLQKWARDVYELRQSTFLATIPCFWGANRPEDRASSSWFMEFSFWRTSTINGFSS